MIDELKKEVRSLKLQLKEHDRGPKQSYSYGNNYTNKNCSEETKRVSVLIFVCFHGSYHGLVLSDHGYKVNVTSNLSFVTNISVGQHGLF